jgi:spermidine synthase
MGKRVNINTPAYALITSEERGVRYLHFGSEWVQGAMRISAPDALELEYTRHLMGALAWFESLDNTQTTLQIGLGAASITKFLVRHLPRSAHTVVELDPRVPAFAEHAFSFDPQRVSLHVDDGIAWLAASRERFNLIVTDAFDEDARAGATAELAYYQSVQAHLAPGGVAAFNLFGQVSRYTSAIRALRSAFAGKTLVHMPVCKSGNVVVVGVNEPTHERSRGELAERGRRLRVATGLSLVTALSQVTHI